MSEPASLGRVQCTRKMLSPRGEYVVVSFANSDVQCGGSIIWRMNRDRAKDYQEGEFYELFLLPTLQGTAQRL